MFLKQRSVGLLFLILLSVSFFLITNRQPVTQAQILIPTTPHPEDNSAPRPWIPAQNPFYPSGYNDPTSCRNTTPHRLAHESDRSEEIKLTFRQQQNATDAEKIVDGKNGIGGNLGHSSNQEFAYLAFSLPKQMAITRVGIAWHDAQGFSGQSSVNPNFGSGYMLGTGFGSIPTINEDTEPTCHIGEMYKVSADSLMHEYELGPYPVKADYLLIKKSALAIPTQVTIGEVRIWGVPSQGGLPNEATLLRGKITVTGLSKVPVIHAKLYDISGGEKNKRLVGTTDGEGNFTIDSFKASRKSIKILIERNGFDSKQFSYTIRNGLNEKNLSLSLASPNIIKGVVRSKGFRPVPGILVYAYRNGVLKGISYTDSKGAYAIEVPEGGSYELRVAKSGGIEKPEFLSGVNSASFTRDNGESRTRDIQNVTPALTNAKKIKMPIIIREKLLTTSPDKQGEEEEFEEDGSVLPDAEVKIFAGKGVLTEPILLAKHDDLVELPLGEYTVEVVAKGFKTAEEVIDTRNLPDVVTTFPILILLQPISNPCTQLPQKNVKELYICGASVTQFSNTAEGKQRIKIIDDQIGNLRTKYGFVDLPLKLTFSSVNDRNAYFKGQQSSKECPPKSTPAKDSMIINYPILTELSQEELTHAVTHEWGHGKDYRESNCNAFGFWRSRKEDFRKARDLAGLYSTEIYEIEKNKKPVNEIPSFYAAITDKTFKNHEFGGHPEDDETETYASVFHAQEQHPAELNERFSKEPSDKQNTRLSDLYKNLNLNTRILINETKKAEKKKR